MKRLVWIDEVHGFGWFDTIIGRFEEHDGEQAWATWEEFVECYDGHEIERYRMLLTPMPESARVYPEGSKSLGEQFVEGYAAFFRAAMPEGPRSKRSEALLRRLIKGRTP